MPSLKSLSNGELWEKWKTSLEEGGDVPKSLVLSKRLNEIEDEILERIRSAREERVREQAANGPKLWNR